MIVVGTRWAVLLSATLVACGEGAVEPGWGDGAAARDQRPGPRDGWRDDGAPAPDRSPTDPDGGAADPDSGPEGPVTAYVGCAAGDPEAKLLSEKAPPATLQTGQKVDVSLRFANCSKEIWKAAAATAQSGHKLGSQAPENNETWGLSRVALPADVPPQHAVRLAFKITAPLLPGSYGYRWKILDEWVRWIDQASPRHEVQVEAPPGTCPGLSALLNQQADCSATLQACINQTPQGGALDLPAGRYYLAKQVKLDRVITLRTAGKALGDAPCPVAGTGCAQLVALPALADPYGLLFISAGAKVDHLVIDGNRQGRGGTTAYTKCKAGQNSYGFNGATRASGLSFTNSVSKNALCGSGLEVGAGSNIEVSKSNFSSCGVHTTTNLWADGLTVHDAVDSTFNDNTFRDNTDLDLIFGGCVRCTIQNNTITHSADAAGGAFAALMIHKWPSTSGNYTGAVITGNKVDCGPNRWCGSGLYIASESWYPETPFGSTVPGQVGATINGNSVVNAMNGLYIAAIGFSIYNNGVLNAHGVSIPNSCGKYLVSKTPYVVSPTAQTIDFHGENVDPVMKVHFSSDSWKGCVPNYP